MNPTELHLVESSVAGRQVQLGTVKSTDTYVYVYDVESLSTVKTSPVGEGEVLRQYERENVLRKLDPGEVPAKQLGGGVTLIPAFEFTEDIPCGDTWHIVCEADPMSAGPVYGLGPKVWPPGGPGDWFQWLLISIVAMFVWGAGTGIATAVARRR